MPGPGDTDVDPTPSVEVSVDKLEEIIMTGYLQTWVTAYQEAAMEFQVSKRKCANLFPDEAEQLSCSLHCHAFRLSICLTQAAGRAIGEDQESLMTFQSVAVDKANAMLTKVRPPDGMA